MRAVARPWTGRVPASAYRPPHHAGSPMIAFLATQFQPMPWAERPAVLATAITASTSSGKRAAHSSACMPPREPPEIPRSRRTPSSWSPAREARTMSPTVITGKSGP